MASFDTDAFDVAAFDPDAFDFGALTPDAEPAAQWTVNATTPCRAHPVVGNVRVVVSAGDDWRIRVANISLRSPLDATDLATVTSTIREDPEYPRRPYYNDPLTDPVAEGWEVVGSPASGTVEDAETVYCDFPSSTTELLEGGRKRYVIDVVGVTDGGARVTLFSTNFLTVQPATTAF
jgi:hypothetical protein